jgi:Transposase DDE domain
VCAADDPGSIRRPEDLTLEHQPHCHHQATRQWRQSPEFDQFRKQRQVVEHRIARLVQLGIRQARYFGRRKTLFQLLLAAAVANLTLGAARVAP